MKKSGKFEQKKYKDKSEINARIKEINKKIYSDNGVPKEEYEKLQKELKNLKEQKKEMSENLENKEKKEFEEKIRKTLKGENDDLKKELEVELKNIENFEDDYGIEEKVVDEINTKISKKIFEMYDNGEIEDYEYENFIDNFNQITSNIMSEKGYDVYEHHGKIYYSMLPKAKKAYDNILKELDDKNIKYKVTKSWNPGELPSIYVYDDDENIFRIANHFNSKNQEFEAFKERKKVYSTRDYINYKETIFEDLKEFLKK